MAFEQTIGGEGTLFVGEDKTLSLELLQSGSDPDSSASVPENMAGWAVQFIVRIKDDSTGNPILTKTATVSGSYSATRASNTQRAVVTLTDTDMDALVPRIYRHSWKRTDDGSETVLAYGNFSVQRATQP
jgi:hypothetical protein